ncbi:MAG: hypothetical protein HQ557_18870 [Bacteroidetes bacterium]|nr:hypothetical protein [Bacteroidota bacterium]
MSESTDLLPQINGYIEKILGLHFPRSRWKYLETRLGEASGEFGFEGVESFITWLLSANLTRESRGVLNSYLTIGETYFFRDSKIWEFLEKHVLVEMIHNKKGRDKHIRIWSAGCSTGEEPFSIAVLLARLLPDLKDWDLYIMATDSNTRALEKASTGVYTDWSFRDPPPWLQCTFFNKAGEKSYQILPEIKNMVCFSDLNLITDSYPSTSLPTQEMDIIMCKNVLMYYPKKKAHKIIQQLYRCLTEDGWLIVSAVETQLLSSFPFRRIDVNGMSFFQKVDNKINVPISNNLKESPQDKVNSLPDSETNKSSELFAPLINGIAIDGEQVMSGKQMHSAYEKAKDMYQKGKISEAEELLLQSLANAHRSNTDSCGEEYTLLAELYANQGRLEEALQWSKKAIVKDNINPEVHYLDALINLESGERKEAVKALRRVIYLDPNFAMAHFTLGNLLKSEDRKEDSMRHFRNALRIVSIQPKEKELDKVDGMTAGRLVEVISIIMAEEGVR